MGGEPHPGVRASSSGAGTTRSLLLIQYQAPVTGLLAQISHRARSTAALLVTVRLKVT